MDVPFGPISQMRGKAHQFVYTLWPNGRIDMAQSVAPNQRQDAMAQSGQAKEKFSGQACFFDSQSKRRKTPTTSHTVQTEKPLIASSAEMDRRMEGCSQRRL